MGNAGPSDLPGTSLPEAEPQRTFDCGACRRSVRGRRCAVRERRVDARNYAAGGMRTRFDGAFRAVLAWRALGPEWRNWQTRGTQNPVRLTPSGGSTPPSGTNHPRELSAPARCGSGGSERRCSMRRRGNCCDDAVMESFFSTVKSELRDRFESCGEVKMELFDYIEEFYNQQRRHSTIGQFRPAAFEKARAAQVA